MADEITFAAILEKNRDHLQRIGLPLSPHTVEVSLMHMMSSVGQLATLSFRQATSLSPFEQEEVYAIIGKLVISVAMIAESFDVPAGQAAMDILDAEVLPLEPLQPQTQAPPPQNNSQPPPLNQQPPQAHPPTVEQPIILSPTSRQDFFSQVEKLRGFPKDDFDKTCLKWVAPTPDGRLTEMIPNGSQRTVRYDELPDYIRAIQRYRDDVYAKKNPTPAPAPAVANHTSLEEQLRAFAPPGYDLEKEAQMFSPTHFAQGLFSPMARASDLKLSDVKPPTSWAPARAPSPPMRAGERPASALPSSRVEAAPAPAPAYPTARYGGMPYPSDVFRNIVENLEAGKVSPALIPSLGLTFSLPDGDQVVELVQDGLHITVSAANLAEFLRLVHEYYNNRETARARMTSNRVHRSDSVRRLDVPGQEQGNNNFSPSHFSLGLFAPFEKKSTFYVDYNHGEEMLPPYLRNIQRQSQQQGAHPPGTSTAAARPLTPPTNAATTAGFGSPYLKAVLANDGTTLMAMLQHIAVDPNAVVQYGVTFCVPSSWNPRASAVERESGIHALYPNSIAIPVEPHQRDVFLALVGPLISDA